jgi:hypothetical protein
MELLHQSQGISDVFQEMARGYLRHAVIVEGQRRRFEVRDDIDLGQRDRVHIDPAWDGKPTTPQIEPYIS